MIVITKNAEIKLEKELKFLLKNYPKQLCLYIRLSDIKDIPSGFQENFLEMLHDIPESYRAQIYFCNDNDIFIFMFEFMKRQFVDALKMIATSAKIPQFLDHVTVYCVKNNYEEMVRICQEKNKAIHDETLKHQEEKRRKISDQNVVNTLANLNSDSVKAIPQKRSIRHKPLIQIIDDDQLSRTLVENVLRHDYSVHLSKNGQTGLQDYVEQIPDVVFLDIGLPDIGGHEMLEALSQIDPDHYVIMFSGRRDKTNLLKALRLGAQGFVGKPFTRDKLIAYINRSPFLADNVNASSETQDASATLK
tara:strand:+ start:249 stop:1163 length:915 start_codon:yes stop_codon:yes gene_type:complete